MIARQHEIYGDPPVFYPYPSRHRYRPVSNALSHKIDIPRQGNVFRVSPNELSFSTMSSYKAIYGPYPRSHAPFVKSDFYKIFGAGFDSRCIGSEQNPTAHARMKKLLTPAFSVKALSEQEEIVQGCIDGLVAKLATLGAPEEGLDMTAWYEMIAFDILGEMAFGESFHCVEEERPHFWQQLIAKHLFFITVVDNLRRYPFLRWLGKTLLPHLTVKVQNKHSGYSRQKIAK